MKNVKIFLQAMVVLNLKRLRIISSLEPKAYKMSL